MQWLDEILATINDWFKGFGFDEKILSLYNEYIVPLPEIVKILGGIFLVLIIVLGLFSFVKKFIKVAIVLAIVVAIIIFLTNIM